MLPAQGPSASRHIVLWGKGRTYSGSPSEQMAAWGQLFREAVLTPREELRVQTDPRAFHPSRFLCWFLGNRAGVTRWRLCSVLPSLLLVCCCHFMVSEGGAGLGSTDPGAEHLVHPRACPALAPLRPLAGPARTARILCPQDQSPANDLG